MNIFNINLNHLKYFVDAARSGSLSAAATENYLTHSAISHAIKSLEIELDCSLINHKRRSFEITEAGKYVLENSKDIFDSVAAFREAIPQESNEVRGSVSFATSSSLALSIVAPVIAELVSKHPKLQIKFKLGNSDTIKQWVKNKEIDFGIVLDDESLVGLRTQKLSSGTFHIVRSAKQKQMKLNNEGVMVTRIEKPECRELLKLYKNKEKSPLKIKMQVLSWEVIKALTSAGAGFGFLPDYAIREELREKSLISVTTGFTLPKYNLLAISLKTRKLSANSLLMIDAVLATLNKR